MKARRQRKAPPRLEKYVLNPPLRMALHLGIAPGNFALLATIGRRTGILRLAPVGNGLDGDTFWLVAEHGRRCGYVQNLIARPRVRVKADGVWRTGEAHLVPDDDGFARRRRIDSANGMSGRFDGWVFAKKATTPLTIRIDLDPEPGPPTGTRA